MFLRVNVVAPRKIFCVGRTTVPKWVSSMGLAETCVPFSISASSFSIPRLELSGNEWRALFSKILDHPHVGAELAVKDCEMATVGRRAKVTLLTPSALP